MVLSLYQKYWHHFQKIFETREVIKQNNNFLFQKIFLNIALLKINLFKGFKMRKRTVIQWQILKRAIILMFLLCLLLSLVGCTKKNDSQLTNSNLPQYLAKETVIGLCMDCLDEVISEVVRLMQAEAARMGVKTIVTNADGSASKQMSDLESLITQKPDVILISSVDNTSGITLVEKAHAAGIKVLEMRGVVSDAIDVSFLGISEDVMAQRKASYLEQQLLKNPNLRYNIGYIFGSPEMVLQLKRIDGIKALADKYPDRVRLVVQAYGNWRSDQAMNIMEDWLQTYPNLNCIAAASDDMALGVISALKGAKKLEQFTIVSIDGSGPGCQAVADGSLSATVMMNNPMEAKAMMGSCINLAWDLFTQKYLSIGPEGSILVTKENVAEVR